MTTLKIKRRKAGRTILMAAAAFTAVGGFVADMNKTHMFNPKWTPHAKFHDAMTIMLGAMLGSGSLYLLQKNDSDEKNELLATILPAFFWTSMATAFAFPGAKGLEADFPEKIKRVGGVTLNEGPASVFMLLLLGVGYILVKKETN